MLFHRRLRLAGGRPRFITALLFVTVPAIAFAEVSGVVVDPTGRPLPRAYVRGIGGRDAEAGVFADERGRFTLPISAPCSVEATLTGFQAATRPCGSDPLRIELAVAPVRETVLVTATRTDAPTSQVGASATVFTADDLERLQNPLIADLLTATPGAMVVRSGGAGTLTSLFVRGGESDYNKILLDGVPLNEPGGAFYLNNLTTENIERVEIVRGAYSALFGSDAMASVIQLFTRKGEGRTMPPHVWGQVDGGTYATSHVTTGVSGAAHRLDYSAGFARLDTDNRVPNNALDNTTLSGNLGVRLAERAELRVLGRGELEKVGTPGPTAFGRPDLGAFFQRHDGVMSVSFDQQVASSVRQRALYSLTVSNQDSTDLVKDLPFRATYQGRVAAYDSNDFTGDTRNELRRQHASYQADWRLPVDARHGTQTLSFLVDWSGEHAVAIDRIASSRTSNSRDSFGVGAEQQLLWRRVSASIGGRIEHNESFGTAAVPRATLVYVLHDGTGRFGETHLRASAGAGIKEPAMLESFSVSPYFLGNPNLKPERSRSAELGVEQRLANDRAKVGLAYFNNRFRDVISLRTTDPVNFFSQFDNVGVTRARGLEVSAEAAPVAALTLHGSYTLLDGRVVDTLTPNDPVFGVGHELFRRPRHSGTVGISFSRNRVTAALNGVFLGRFVDSDFGLFGLVENPGHRTWDARASVRVTQHVTGVLMIDNLTNRDYAEVLGYQPLLRTIRAGIRVGL
jgi:outer membrane cobalamin receptor